MTNKDEALNMAIKRLLHLIPFVHFYNPWKMCKEQFGGSDRQYTHCQLCNKKKHRLVNDV